jgi:hypothetical protein
VALSIGTAAQFKSQASHKFCFAIPAGRSVEIRHATANRRIPDWEGEILIDCRFIFLSLLQGRTMNHGR